MCLNSLVTTSRILCENIAEWPFSGFTRELTRRPFLSDGEIHVGTFITSDYGFKITARKIQAGSKTGEEHE